MYTGKRGNDNDGEAGRFCGNEIKKTQKKAALLIFSQVSLTCKWEKNYVSTAVLKKMMMMMIKMRIKIYAGEDDDDDDGLG